MQLERIPEWLLDARDEAAIADLLERAFREPGRPSGFDGRSYFHQRHHLRLVMRDGGAIVGHMALLFRAVRLGGQLLDIAGLAEVATDAGRRGEGIAGRLLAEAIAVSRQSRAAFLLLFGGAGLYTAAGFHAARNPIVAVAMAGARTGAVTRGPADALMVLPLRQAPWDPTAELDLLGPLF